MNYLAISAYRNRLLRFNELAFLTVEHTTEYKMSYYAKEVVEDELIPSKHTYEYLFPCTGTTDYQTTVRGFCLYFIEDEGEKYDVFSIHDFPKVEHLLLEILTSLPSDDFCTEDLKAVVSKIERKYRKAK